MAFIGSGTKEESKVDDKGLTGWMEMYNSIGQ